MEQIWTSSENTRDVAYIHIGNQFSIYTVNASSLGKNLENMAIDHTIVVLLKIQLQGVQGAPNVCDIQKQSGTSNELATYRPPHPVITTF